MDHAFNSKTLAFFLHSESKQQSKKKDTTVMLKTFRFSTNGKTASSYVASIVRTTGCGCETKNFRTAAVLAK